MYSYDDIYITVFALVGTCSSLNFPECLVPLVVEAAWHSDQQWE